MSVKQNKELIEKWYKAVTDSDFETIFDMHHEDVVYNILGNTPVSGRIYEKDACCNGMIGQKLLEKLIPEIVKFSKEWKIIAAEGDRVVGVMKGGGPCKNGEDYEQTYCEIFTIRDGKNIVLHTFFDTVLIEQCLFDNSLKSKPSIVKDPFHIN
jgi:ketosteroid isomerase-like protein